LPAIFGTTSSIQLLTSGIGLIAFILYLPGGLAEVMHRIGDALATGVDQMLARRHPPPSDGVAEPPATVDATVRDPMPAPLTGEVV
jgi:hypothetical protein